ncbi:uncharacterized protein [Mobula birostris]|uniref:uncharacterized protein isoform X3 n=1 Tax=Mobula birostris TaxID=1983395 RepID=UPI003B27EB21
MDESETYANMRFTGADSQSPSRTEPDVSYVELNVTALSAPRVRRDGDSLSSSASYPLALPIFSFHLSPIFLRSLYFLSPLSLSLPFFPLPLSPYLIPILSPHSLTPNSSSIAPIVHHCLLFSIHLSSFFSPVFTRSFNFFLFVFHPFSASLNILSLPALPSPLTARCRCPHSSFSSLLSHPPSLDAPAGLSSTYAEVNCPKDEPVIDEDEAPPIAAGPRKQTTNAQTGAHEQEPKQNIENRRYMKICLLCLFTSVLIAIVAGLSISVSHIRQSKCILDRNYDELNSTLQSKINEMEAKYKAVKETKAQICELLTSRREQTCPQDWIDNEDRCYLISRLENSYDGAREHCSKFDARLLEINSNVERDFVSSSFDSEYRYHWIENCGDGHTMDPPPALSATRTHRATVVKGNRDSSARSLHIYTQIFLKRSKVSVNTPWDRLQSNDNTPLHPIQSTPLSPPHPFIPSQPLCPNTYPILLLYSHPHSPPLLPLPPSELLFFPLGPALPISATHIYSPFPTLFTLCPSNPQLIPLLFFPLLHGPHFLPPLSGSLHQLSLQFRTHWPSVHQQRGKVCAHSPCLCLSWLHTYAPRNKAPSFMPSLHNSDPRVPATSS